MNPIQNNSGEKNQDKAPLPSEKIKEQPVDADEVVHELPDREPEIPADPDDLVHTFPPPQDVINTDDIDDIIHPPAVDGNDEP